MVRDLNVGSKWVYVFELRAGTSSFPAISTIFIYKFYTFVRNKEIPSIKYYKQSISKLILMSKHSYQSRLFKYLVRWDNKSQKYLMKTLT